MIEMPSDLRLRGEDRSGDSTSQHHEKNKSTSDAPDRSSTACLDGLRGLAAVTVFIQHWIGTFTFGIHEYGFGQQGHYHFISLPFINPIWRGGDASVVIFFVLSGYVLSIGHLHKLRQQKPIKWPLISAVLRRPVRLYAPCIAVELIHVFLLHIPGLLLPMPGLQPQETIFKELWTFVQRTVLYFNPFQVHESGGFWYAYDIVMWTIPIELKGSCLIFAILGVYSWISPGTNHWKVAMPTGLLFIAAAVMLQMCFKWSMANFILGFVLAVTDVWKLDAKLLRALSPEQRSFGLHTLLFAGWYLLSLPHRPGQIFAAKTPGYQWLASLIPSSYSALLHYRFWQSWGAVFFVYALLRIEWIQRRLSTPTMKFLGRVSFMLYLTHLTFIRIFADRLNSLLGGAVDDELEGTMWDASLWIPDIGPLGLSSRYLTCMAISLPLSLLVAKYFTDWIDDPIVRVARRMTAGLGRAKRKDGGDADEEPMLPVSRTRRNSL